MAVDGNRNAIRNASRSSPVPKNEATTSVDTSDTSLTPTVNAPIASAAAEILLPTLRSAVDRRRPRIAPAIPLNVIAANVAAPRPAPSRRHNEPSPKASQRHAAGLPPQAQADYAIPVPPQPSRRGWRSWLRSSGVHKAELMVSDPRGR